MTVSSAVTRNDYTATGGQTIFPYTFETFASSDLVVLQNGTILSEGSQYTVSGVGLDAGGDITLLSGATASDAISVYLDMDLTRTTDYQNSGDFLASEVNDDFDRAWLATKQQQNSIDRSLRLPDADSTLDMALPVLASRKGTVLAFDETTGLPVVGPTISDVSSIASITADIARLADIEDGTLATDAIQTTAAISTNVTTVAGISANVTTVAGNTANINTVAGNDANITTVAGVSAGVSTLAPISADITATASNAADISTVATNIVDVTNFADVYQGPSASDPTVRNDASALQTGDLYFNTTTNELRAYSGSAWTSTSGGSVSVTRFSGTGAQTAYALPTTPSSENNTQVYVDGIYQQKDTYSVSGATLTFSEAPPLDTDNIEVTTIEALALGATSSDLVSHIATGTGAVATTVQAKLRETVSVKDFGAVGNGTTDDTTAWTAWVASGGNYIPVGSYLVSSVVKKYIVPTFVNVESTGNHSSGYLALESNTTGYNNTAYGRDALNKNTTGYDNVALGLNAMKLNIDGERNTAVGLDALAENISGDHNLALGQNALRKNSIGTYNTALGIDALEFGLNNNFNTAIAQYAGLNLQGASGNTLVGYNTLPTAASGDGNTTLGKDTLRDQDGVDGNTAIGTSAARGNTTGTFITAVGFSAGRTNTVGTHLTLLGDQAAFSNLSGTHNLAIGFTASYSNVSGEYNVAIGDNALFSNTASNNIGVGGFAGYNITTGTQNTFIGYAAGFTGSQKVDAVNTTAIGRGSFTTKDNTVQLGNTDVIGVGVGDNKIEWLASIPTTGTWARGSVVYNLSVVAGGSMGWMCITAGTFGATDPVFKTMPNVAA